MAGKKGRSGGNRSGSGRPPTKDVFRASPGTYIVFQKKSGRVPQQQWSPELGSVIACSPSGIEVSVNGIIYEIRLPQEGEIGLV